MRIWYHGTKQENAQLILDSGFRAGTYFASGLQDALGFGGEYVFEVILNVPEPHGWQVSAYEDIPAGHIVGLTRYRVTKIKDNQELRDKLFQSSISAEVAQ